MKWGRGFLFGPTSVILLVQVQGEIGVGETAARGVRIQHTPSLPYSTFSCRLSLQFHSTLPFHSLPSCPASLLAYLLLPVNRDLAIYSGRLQGPNLLTLQLLCNNQHWWNTCSTCRVVQKHLTAHFQNTPKIFFLLLTSILCFLGNCSNYIVLTCNSAWKTLYCIEIK